MASRYHWRQRLLGSMQGQLQLATYLVVFLGFTGAWRTFYDPNKKRYRDTRKFAH